MRSMVGPPRTWRTVKSFPENMGSARARHGRFGLGSVDRRWLTLPRCGDWQTRESGSLLRARRPKSGEMICGNRAPPISPRMKSPKVAWPTENGKTFQMRNSERSMEFPSESIANRTSCCQSCCARLIQKEKKREPRCRTCKYRVHWAETRSHLGRLHAISVWDGRTR